MHHHAPITLFYHISEHTVHSGRQRRIAVREHVHVAALGPADVRGRVDRLLDVGAVEVEREGLRLGEGAWEAEDIPEDRELNHPVKHLSVKVCVVCLDVSMAQRPTVSKIL